MDILPSGNIFRELQDIHDTGYFSAQPSLEDHWQQVRMRFIFFFLSLFETSLRRVSKFVASSSCRVQTCACVRVCTTFLHVVR
ncbi:Krueppel-like factor 7 [Habropoda laboriosa]|uniref:Krueppel-like factor 7 n=1 Tax=Habropoda laboriosa TaxID=597456 RepID=A0A0L7R8D4_9HYME|nr:Krueppel-like factor 7 [Habropoda laboriosa]